VPLFAICFLKISCVMRLFSAAPDILVVVVSSFRGHERNKWNTTERVVKRCEVTEIWIMKQSRRRSCVVGTDSGDRKRMTTETSVHGRKRHKNSAVKLLHFVSSLFVVFDLFVDAESLIWCRRFCLFRYLDGGNSLSLLACNPCACFDLIIFWRFVGCREEFLPNTFQFPKTKSLGVMIISYYWERPHPQSSSWVIVQSEFS
jgi:hypothetical protein